MNEKKRLLVSLLIIKKLTDEERQSKLGEDLFPESVGERILILQNLLKLLDKNSDVYITALHN